MSSITIKPKKICGNVAVPPSKSIAHRALICAALSNSTSVISNISFSDDIIATVEAMKNAGAEIEVSGTALKIKGISTIKELNSPINCKESGSTLRFLVPVMLSLFSKATFKGEGRLGKRPLEVYYDIFKSQGITYSVTDEPFELKISGKLKNGVFKVPGNVSSQFITGLLLALPMLEQDSEIEITTALESKGYLDLTLDVMGRFGVKVINDDYRHFYIKGNQRYTSCAYTVEGDYSQAAFFEVANFIGNDIQLCGMTAESLQGDKQILDIIAKLKSAPSSETVIIDGAQCPDIVPITAVAACLRPGNTSIVNLGRLRFKESDRLSAVAEELTKMGGNIKVVDDTLAIEGVSEFHSCNVDSHNDHRIAMMLAIAATRSSGNVTINDYKCVAKSYPDFFEVYKSLGGDICE